MDIRFCAVALLAAINSTKHSRLDSNFRCIVKLKFGQLGVGVLITQLFKFVVIYLTKTVDDDNEAEH